MKKILVPTDFSAVANNALEHAIEIAAEFTSELYLYHAYFIHKIDYDLTLPVGKQPYRKRVEQRMNRTELKFMKKIRQKGLSMQTLVEEDDFYSLFKDKVKEHGIDLIVMGSKGASGLIKAIFGSVAATAIEWAAVPVLIVPPQHAFHPIRHIVLAMDDGELASSVLSPLQKLAARFGAKVTILNVNTGLNKNTDKMKGLYLDGIETTYREVPKSKSINESIDKFISKEGADLLCMIRRKKGFIESIFSKSITKTQAYSNRIPLLVLPEA